MSSGAEERAADRRQEEADRLTALRTMQILDTDAEPSFDDLTLLASHICETPMAAITFVDTDRQWFKARVGIPVSETPRSVAFCSHAIANDGIFVVRDAAKDATFRDNPQVTGEPHVRFYAGAPLMSREGHAVGTLCVIDRRPRTLTPDQMQALDALRRQVEAQLDLRRRIAELKLSHENVQKLTAMMPLCSTCQFSMTIPADPAAIPRITDGVTSVLTQKQWPEDQVMAVELALQEAVANAIRHGCSGDATKQLQCTVNIDAAGEVVITVRDPGPGFNPLTVADPLAPENVLKPSGRGIFLINGLMDDVEFADGGRELTMRKKKQ
ncbi:MAG: ATP-binding protein [Acidobacteriota bacterium]|nr:ATP-binding protein [Acidobacteriota bacterium]MDQ3419569.1 ATP-binding protein [Acidobacteriota bacterium]